MANAPAVKGVSPQKKGTNPLARRSMAGYLLCLPMLLSILIFVIYPMIMVVIYSFQNTNGVTATPAGLNNYRWVLGDSMFWGALLNTAKMAIMAIVADIVVCFVIASLINSLVRGKNFFKGLYYLPNVVSTVAVAMIFNFLFYPTKNGVINFLLDKLGAAPKGWLVMPNLAQVSIVIMGLWRSIGYDTILFLAGLQSIPREIYEAAEVDGASGLQKWWHITIPNMKPTFSFMIIMLTISTLRRFDDVWLIGGVGGNPGGSLQTIVLYIYRNAWISRQVGVASSASVVLFLIMFVVTFFNYRLTSKPIV